MQNQKQSFFFTILAGIMVAATLTANICAVKTVQIMEGITLPGGFIIFPVVYIVSDVISECYGFRRSRWLAWLSLGLNLLVVGMYKLITMLPSAPWSIDINNALISVTGSTFMVLLGGIVSMTLGGWTNDIIFQAFKHKDGLEKFSKRKVLSSAGGEAVDTAVFITVGLGFSGIIPWAFIPQTILVQYIGKLVVEYALLPFTQMAVKAARNYEGVEAFEDVNNFNIFGFRKK
jgi:uncharacterized integral membrane protein (TIGR00697 family)